VDSPDGASYPNIQSPPVLTWPPLFLHYSVRHLGNYPSPLLRKRHDKLGPITIPAACVLRPQRSFARRDSSSPNPSSLLSGQTPSAGETPRSTRLLDLQCLRYTWVSSLITLDAQKSHMRENRDELKELTLPPTESLDEAATTMATTTVTGHGRRSSMRQPELQVPNKPSTSQPTSSPIDKFPPYEDSMDAAVGSATPSTRPHRSPSVKYAPGEPWEPRKSAFYSQNHPNGSLRNPKHRPRKSISEAITTIRNRNGSMSANAQELAEALRAPVSYRLIVR
jgi:hypothetical protein